MELCFLLCLTSFLGLSYAQCFAPDGSWSPDSKYTPCILTNGVDSMCCLTNTTTPEDADTCLPSGQCLRKGVYYRNLCTDKAWKSPNCLNVCTDNLSGGNASGLSQMTQCFDGTWCCGFTSNDCCSKNEGFKLAIAISPYMTQKTRKNWLGIILGVALGVALLGNMAVGLLSFQLYRKTRRNVGGQRDETSHEDGLGTRATEDNGRGRRSGGTTSSHTSHIELSLQSVAYEVPEGALLAELDGNYKRVSSTSEAKATEGV